MLQLQRVVLKGALSSYRPLPYRPPMATHPSLGQAGAVTAIGATPMLIGAAVSGVFAVAGFAWVRNTTSGFQKALGYILGGMGAIGALIGVGGALLWGNMVNAASTGINQQGNNPPLTLPPLPTVTERVPATDKSFDFNSFA